MARGGGLIRRIVRPFVWAAYPACGTSTPLCSMASATACSTLVCGKLTFLRVTRSVLRMPRAELPLLEDIFFRLATRSSGAGDGVFIL